MQKMIIFYVQTLNHCDWSMMKLRRDFCFCAEKRRKRNQRKNNSEGNRNKPINVKRDETNQLKN